MEPKIKKFPIEVFGHVYTDNDEIAKEDRTNQYCPYLHAECNKPRKSEPEIKVGICTVGYKGSFVTKFIPVVICPQRFLEEVIFDTIKEKYFPSWENVKWIKEVDMGVSGNVDFVAAKMNNNNIEDFLCVEFQAAGTTGSPYEAVGELLIDGKYYRDTYNYGINWANEFMKTMMQQVYKKGKVVKHWDRKIVFVIQDVAMQYIESAVDTSGLREDINDEIQFLMFGLVWDDEKGKYILKNNGWKTADLDAINKILAGASKEKYLTEKEFMNNIAKKGKKDGDF